MKHTNGLTSSAFGGIDDTVQDKGTWLQLHQSLMASANIIPEDLFKLSIMSLLLFSLGIFLSILASDLSPNTLFQRLCEFATADNIGKLWVTSHRKLRQLQHKYQVILWTYWSDSIRSLLYPELETIQIKLQLLQAKIRTAEKRYERDQKRCDDRSDEMKGITQLLQILQETVYDLEKRLKRDVRACESRRETLHALQGEELVALGNTLNGLFAAGERFRDEQQRLAEEQAVLKDEQKRLADAQRELMDQSMPNSDSIEKVQTEVESLRSYLLVEADSRRNMLDGQRASLDQSR